MIGIGNGWLGACSKACAVAVAAIGLSPTARGAGEPRESWDAVYFGANRAGYVHTTVTPKQDPKTGRDLVNVQVETSLQFKRDRDAASIELLFGTIETPDGSVLRLDSRTLASRQEMKTSGDVINGQMTLTLEGGGQRQQKTIPWGPEVRGPYGAEMSLSRSLMKPGEAREVRIFTPDLNRVGTAKLSAKSIEPVVLGGGVRRDLLRVEQVTFVDDKPLPGAQTHWVDSTGQILKTYIDQFGGMTTYRTTREAALRTNSGPKFDVNAASQIKVRRAISNPTNSREIVYDVTLKGDDPSKVFPVDARQSVTPGANPNAARLVVKSGGPTVGEAGPEAVDAQYLRPNALVTSDDPRVAALAMRVAGPPADPWGKAVAVQHWVFENLKKKNFETVFAPASEVARDLEGDCTEHSVLTAAILRAAGVPARVVVGLLYVEPNQSFGFHMWNEVYVNRRWVAVDSAFDQSTVDAVHIKLVESSLDGIAPYETFLAVVRVLNKTAIEPVEVR